MPGQGFSVPPATRPAGTSLQEMQSVTLQRKLSQRLQDIFHIPVGPAVYSSGGWAKERKDPIGQRHSAGKVDGPAGSSLGYVSFLRNQGPRL